MIEPSQNLVRKTTQMKQRERETDRQTKREREREREREGQETSPKNMVALIEPSQNLADSTGGFWRIPRTRFG
jgi:hypothetical protein